MLEMDIFLLKCSVSVENNNSCNICLVNAASLFQGKFVDRVCYFNVD